MEFTPSQIARLVLGYLKAEKCHTAFDTFYNTSPHFEYSSNNKRAKYVVTRVQGNSLRDFLNEYALIYNLVQERLEPTDYYDECSSRNIVDQLTYLLDKFCHTRQNTPQRSRSSTPILKQCYKNKSPFQQDLSVIEEQASSELNTTPLEDLPGNSYEFNKTPARRSGIKTNKNTAVEESDSGDSPDNVQEEVQDIEVLKQTLLEHTELHEKIAENINLVINTNDSNKIVDEKISNELNSAIKAIVEKTEADPIFEKLIGDLIGSTEQPTATDRRYLAQYDTLQSQSIHLYPDIQQSSSKPPEGESDTIKQRLRNPRKPTTEITNNISIQTDALPAVPPLCAIPYASKSSSSVVQPATASSHDIHKNLTVNTNTGDVILYDGTLDNYMKSSTAPIVTSTNPIIFNNNLLMVQPGLIQSTPATSTLTNAVPVDKSYYVLNSSQLLNVSVPQYKLNNVTEQDILNMPTVIVRDDNRQASHGVKSSTVKELPKLLPKDLSDSNIREYLTLYQCTDDQQSPINTPKPKTLSVPQKKDPLKPQNIQIEILKPVVEETKHQPKDINPANVTEKPSSPRPTTPESNKQPARKATPKSGSHVRALDFNLTPGHTDLSTKPTSPKSTKKKSPSKMSATKISKSLFGSPTKTATKVEDNETKVDGKIEDQAIAKKNGVKDKKLASWDSDLRALMGPVKERTPPKKKKKESVKKTTKKTKADLNKTEMDAKAIEDNLKHMDVEPDKQDNLKIETNTNQNDENLVKNDEELKTVSVNKVEEYDDQSVMTFTLINCNAKARCKRKCNIDNTISKAVKITKVKEIKSLEIIPDSGNKLILSPSKLNANKRTLVDNIESTEPDGAPSIAVSTCPAVLTENNVPPVEKQDDADLKDNTNPIMNEKSKETSQIVSEDTKKDEANKTTKDGKFTTPDMPRIPNTLPVTANCNLTPLLETPMKYLETPIKLNELPKTPGANISTNIITPMTKMLNEQLQGVDLLSMQTPKFPLTPSFPFTPFNTKSPYPNRSTDYSTTSSYYQPSDSEQNKSLEALLEECRRLENKQEPVEREVLEEEVQIHSSISEKISTFNHSQIARKNLSLVKKDLENSSSEESSSSEEESSSSSEDETNSSGSLSFSKNEVIVVKRATTPYSLRPRKSLSKEETIHDIVSHAEVKPELGSHPAINSKEAILKEVEEKRKRTIAKFKQGENAPPTRRRKSATEKLKTEPKKTTPQRDINGKFLSKSKTKATPKPLKTETVKITKPASVNKRKSKSPMKLPQTEIVKDFTNEDVLLHISSDDDRIRPLDVVETELLESESSLTINHPLNTFQKALDSFKSNMKGKENYDNISDQEAKSLVEGLKQRGIYLVPNKTPGKKNEAKAVSRETVGDTKIISTSSDLNKIKNDKPKQNETNQTLQLLKELGNDCQLINKTEAEDKKAATKTDVKKQEVKNHVPKKKKTSTGEPITGNKPIQSQQKKDSQNKTSSTAVKLESKTKVTKTLAGAKTASIINASHEEGKILNDISIKTKSETTNKKPKRTQSITKTRDTTKSDTKASTPNKPAISSSSLKTESTKIKDRGKNPPNNENIKQPDELTSKEDNKDKNVDDIKNNAESESKMPPLATTASHIEQDLNMTDSITDEVFDDKNLFEETFNFVYDPDNTSNKTLEEYNLPISNKCFVVEVFGHQIEMSVTPFEITLDIPERKLTEKVKILQNTVINDGRDISPLHKLYAHLTAPPSNMDAISPLDNLYSEKNSTGYCVKKVQRLKVVERRRNSMEYKREPKSRKTTRSKSVDYNSLNASPDNAKTEKKNTSVNSNAKKSASSGSAISKKEKAVVDSIDKKNMIKDVTGESPNPKPSPREIDDELMTYAICGSERTENDAEDKGRSHKRKATGNIDDTEIKKMKCQEILKNIDVDDFLTQLHGKS